MTFVSKIQFIFRMIYNIFYRFLSRYLAENIPCPAEIFVEAVAVGWVQRLVLRLSKHEPSCSELDKAISEQERNKLYNLSDKVERMVPQNDRVEQDSLPE